MPVRWKGLRSISVETYCILHLTSFSTRMGFEGVKYDLLHSGIVATYLVDFFGFEDILENLEVGDEFILVLGIHLDTRHRYIT